MRKLPLSIVCTVLSILTLFSSCLHQSRDITPENKTEILITSHNNRTNNPSKGNRYKVSTNKINENITNHNNKPAISNNNTYPFHVKVKNTNPAYWPASASIEVIFNNHKKEYSDITSLTKGIDDIFYSGVDKNAITVYFLIAGSSRKIYEDVNFNIDDCPEYVLEFYAKYEIPLIYDLVANKNGLVCVR